MEDVVRIAVVVLAGLFAFVGLAEGAFVFAIVSLGVAGWALHQHKTESQSGLERIDATESTGHCARCGRMIAAEKDRCDDCSVVGSWRK